MNRHTRYFRCDISSARVDRAQVTSEPGQYDVVVFYFRGSILNSTPVAPDHGAAMLVTLGFTLIDTNTVPA